MSDDTAENLVTEVPDEGAENSYGAAQMKYLSDIEHVRNRPGMYIGDTGPRGLHHLIQEAVDNSIDEAMAGQAMHISVTINNDGSATVEDDGRGIPVEIHPDLSEKLGRPVSTLEGVMTMLKFGGKFDKQAYKTSGGLHGIGVKAVNFLPEECEVEVRRDGHVYQQEYARGVPTGPVRKLGKVIGKGTKTTFRPDPQLFGNLKFDYDTLHRRLQELAFLNAGVKIVFLDKRINQDETVLNERGLLQFIEHLNRASDAIHRVIIHMKREVEGDEVEVAFQYTAE